MLLPRKSLEKMKINQISQSNVKYKVFFDLFQITIIEKISTSSKKESKDIIQYNNLNKNRQQNS
jgi:hypothetical protein